VIQDLARKMLAHDIRPELEAFDLGMVNCAHDLLRKALIRPPLSFNLILGNIACARANRVSLGLMVKELPAGALWSAGGIGDARRKMNAMALVAGGGVQVGLEDNRWSHLPGHQPRAGGADPGLRRGPGPAALSPGRGATGAEAVGSGRSRGPVGRLTFAPPRSTSFQEGRRAQTDGQRGRSMTQSPSKISVVIPVYRSAPSLPSLVERLQATLDRLGGPYEIVLVDDCSPDDSWQVLRELKQQHPEHLKIVRLLVNGGQHSAILCGFSVVTGDVVVTMDDDLQNPPEEIPKLLDGIDEGYDLVIGAYDSKKHSSLRNVSGGLVDRIQRWIFHLPPDFQLTSFRAVRRSVIDQLRGVSTLYPYVTAMLLSNTAKICNVPVRHDPRPHGESSYTFERSVSLAANLLLNYSPYPLYLVGLICSFAFLFSIGFGVYTVGQVIAYGVWVPGWASTVVIITFFNALILLCLLILGFYISRFHRQLTRSRAAYRIAELHE